MSKWKEKLSTSLDQIADRAGDFEKIRNAVEKNPKRIIYIPKRNLAIACMLVVFMIVIGFGSAKHPSKLPKRFFSGKHRTIYVRDFYNECLDNPYGFVIKVKCTKSYKNVLVYEKSLDVNGVLKDYEGYDDLPREGLFPIADSVSFSSYMLTDVIVQEIYYMGKEISFKVKDIIPLVEYCFIYKEGGWFVMQKDDLWGDDKLFIFEGEKKLIPGKEYLIFGYKDTRGNEYPTNGEYRSIGLWEGKIDIDKNKSPEYYDSSNKNSVINDYIDEYREYLKTHGFVEEVWR